MADADLVPASGVSPPPPSLLAPLTDPAGGPALVRLRSFTAQSAVRKALPLFGSVAALGLAGIAWASLAPAPQRVLYTQLDDAERASVVDALGKASIGYTIDRDTGALSVDEDDLYKARMLVAQDGALAAPESGSDMLDKLPMGASRTLEGERLRAAREHDLMLTIQQIDGVEAVRVHLAEAEKSVFVRDNAPPTASVMLRLARGRQLSDSQVSAVVNLVAGSVPGLTPDAVRVVDQHGRLLSDKTGKGDSDRLELQARMEDKLREQVSQLLTPMLGDGNFSSEIQVELDMDQVTSARESYDKQGVLRSETQAQSQQTGASPAAGVPGVLSNTPPPLTTAQPGAPQGTPTPAATASGAPPVNGESSATRQFELGREVSVANAMPGKIKRISVAVALSAKALKGGKADVDQIKQLVSAAVGADSTRGDQVAVVSRNFDATPLAGLPFYEAAWFAMVLRYGVALLAVILVLFVGVRPLIKALKRDPAASPADGEAQALPSTEEALTERVTNPATGAIDRDLLSKQVGLAQRLVAEQPESAVIALRQMLAAHKQAEAAT
ncbi:MAG: flagellar M-ring protein FliF [Sphingomonadales bacterium]|nr:flagellar M-ring protein FliF [Sphingomonadales bacterium]